jgi:hypothetical protein
MLHRAARGADATTLAAAAETDEDMDLNTSDDFELVPESVPTPAGEESISAGTDDPSSTTPVAEESPAADAGPFHKRLVRDKQQIEMSERARLWAEMRSRERRASLTLEESAETETVRAPRERNPYIRKVLGIAAAIVVVVGLGGGGYYWYSHREIKLTSEEVAGEYAKDTKAATQKYTNRWIQVSGNVVIQTEGKSTRVGFDGPKDAKWHIEFSLPPTVLKDLKSGQEITVRCKLAPRKNPDANLTLSNCNLVK